MNDRLESLRRKSFCAAPAVCVERALLMTDFYRRHAGKHSAPMLRAMAFSELCQHKTIAIGPNELIVGDRGAAPNTASTYPEITCHGIEDLKVLRSRDKVRYQVSDAALEAYERVVIPYWQGRSVRDRAFAALDDAWKACYGAGVFTEFLEQRAPGHTALDGTIYRRGLSDLKGDIARHLTELEPATDPLAYDRREQLVAMGIACDALIVLARRHGEEAQRLARGETDPGRCHELLRIAQVCSRVPAHAPRSFWEALQMYWFVHLGVVMEANGWDAMSPGYLDRHLLPFYERELATGALSREDAKELLACLFIKLNDQPAPPKVGVTAAESGTYNDFVNINLGGVLENGEDASSELSLVILEVLDELHLLQPGSNLQCSVRTPERLLAAACRVIRKGYGFPSLFNSDGVVGQLLRGGKSLDDARTGGTSGCVETGCFGKEAYFLTGYLSLPKVLEVALHQGVDPRTGDRVGLAVGAPSSFASFDELYGAFERQLVHFVNVKIGGNHLFERLHGTCAPVPLLSVFVADCITQGVDYNAGGARYNTSYIQGVGIGTVTDSLSAIKTHVFDRGDVGMATLLEALERNFVGHEPLRLRLQNKTPRYGNDDEAADALMRRVFASFHGAVEGRRNGRGGSYHIDMLPTTCHVYFGSVTGATPDGRRATAPLSEGISPVQGADRHGPTAVIRSAAKMDHAKTGGTLLNQKLMPSVVAGEDGIRKLAQLVRTYFRLGGHHIQFNVVDEELLRAAQRDPQRHRHLLVRVAGYSDYFCDLSREMQEEIIARTAHQDL